MFQFDSAVHARGQESVAKDAGIAEPGFAASVAAHPYAGILDDPLLIGFFETDHQLRGYREGVHYRTLEQMEYGKHVTIAEFQCLLETMCSRKELQLAKLRSREKETEGISEVTTEQLQIAEHLVGQQIEVLRKQMAAAAECKGWVWRAVSQYQLGYAHGTRAAMRFDLL